MSLTLGSPAPELKVGTWVQGEPVHGFTPGHLYVVEFWATWCGPCRGTVPHLSQLAKQHAGKVTVIGVAIWERDNPQENVPAFVASMGERMSYTVAIDTDDNYMAEAWMAASGRQGIPSSFVVDGAGNIAWIGHPANGLDAAISGLLSGTYDPAEVEKQLAEERMLHERRKHQQELLAPYMAALEAKNYEDALKAIDNLGAITSDPSRVAVLKIQAAVTCGKPDEALHLMGQIPEDLFIPLGMTVSQIPESTEPLIQAAIKAIERTSFGGKPVEMVVFGNYTLSLLYARLRETEEARSHLNLAFKACEAAGEAAKQFYPMLEEQRDRLRD